MRSLALYTGPEIVRALQSGTEDDSPEVRAAALWSLWLVAPGKALPLAVLGLDDKDAQLRQAAVSVLIQTTLGKRACVRLVNDKSPTVRATVLYGCIKLLPAKQLLISMHDNSSHVRLYLATALKELDDPVAEGILRHMGAHDQKAQVREVAIGSLIERERRKENRLTSHQQTVEGAEIPTALTYDGDGLKRSD